MEPLIIKYKYHMFHADADFSVAVKSSVEAHDVGGVTLVQHLQLPNDLVPDGWFDFQVDQLENRGGYLCLQNILMFRGRIFMSDTARGAK